MTSTGERVNVVAGQIPQDYHCRCEWCSKAIGELRQPDGSYYNRLERRKYYAPEEKGKGGHIAKTPLHIARWAIQSYTEEGDWVLDPTIGAGTTAVEAIRLGRNAAGMEIEYGKVLEANLTKAMNGHEHVLAKVGLGDARNIARFLDEDCGGQTFSLIVNNPPYSGDINMPSPKGKLRGKEFRHLETRFDYDENLPNLAFMDVTGDEYAAEITRIYGACIDKLKAGGHFVVGVKDMTKDWAPLMIHQVYCRILSDLNLDFVGTAFLNHYPRTLHLNTYANKKGNVNHVPPPFYQTISVFRKL